MADETTKSGEGKGQHISIEPAGEKGSVPAPKPEGKPVPPGTSGPPPVKSGD